MDKINNYTKLKIQISRHLIFAFIIAFIAQMIIALLNLNTTLIYAFPHIIILCTSLYVDYKNTKSVFSPFYIFCAIYFVVIIVPIVNNDEILYEHLSQQALQKGSTTYLIFLTIAVFVYFSSSKNKQIKKQFLDFSIYKYIKSIYYITLLVACLGFILRLQSFSQYNFFSVKNLLLNPIEEYAAARQEGRNWATIFNESFAILSILSIILLNPEIPKNYKPAKNLILVGFFIIFINAISSGNKTALFWPFISLISVQGFLFKKLKSSASIPLIVIGMLFLLITFQWRGAFNLFSEAPQVFSQYNHIFYYTSRTIDEINPNFEYLTIAIKDLVTYIIPRAIWMDKPLEMGLSKRYLDYHFIGYDISANRSFSTMGLSETWISSGFIGIVVTAYLFGKLLSWTRNTILSDRFFFNIVFACYLYGTIYFFFRVGFLNFYVYNLIFVYLLLHIGKFFITFGWRPKRNHPL